MLKQMIGKWATAVAGACEDTHGHHGACCDGCAVPETRCPSRIAGQITWKVDRGATAYASIEVRNVGSAARSFKFSPTALAGPEPGSAVLKVTPPTVNLSPGEQTVVSVKLVNSDQLQACQSYFAEVLVVGAWEQAVRVAIHVGADAFSSVNLEHGDSIKDRLFELGQAKSSVNWTFQRGVEPKAAITIHNTASEAQTIALDVTPLVGLESGAATLVFTPSTLVLPRGESGTATLELEHTDSLQPRQDYRAEVRVRGDHEQVLGVKAHVEPDAAAHCKVEQGDPPTRKRAHRWTDHFQCTDGCGGTT